MKYKVLRKEPKSTECFVCGTENKAGLECTFYLLEDGREVCLFSAKTCHEGHPGIMHGGVICAVLDETGGRAYATRTPGSSAYTLELKTNYYHTIPTNTPLICVGSVDEIKEKVYFATAKVILPDGTVAAQSKGVYYILKNQNAEDGGTAYHTVYPEELDLFEIDIPEKDD